MRKYQIGVRYQLLLLLRRGYQRRQVGQPAGRAHNARSVLTTVDTTIITTFLQLYTERHDLQLLISDGLTTFVVKQYCRALVVAAQYRIVVVRRQHCPAAGRRRVPLTSSPVRHRTTRMPLSFTFFQNHYTPHYYIIPTTK